MNLLGGGGTAIVWGVPDLNFAGLGDNVVLASVLITVSVPADDDRLSPPGHKSGDIADDNGFTEDCAVENVSDGSVG